MSDFICVRTQNMCNLWSACTVLNVLWWIEMLCLALPCNALPCLALPCHVCVYIYCLVQRWCVQAAVLVLFLFPEGRMFSVAPSPIDIVWWKIRTRVKTTVPRSEIFSVFCRLQMIFNPGSLQNYLETSLYNSLYLFMLSNVFFFTIMLWSWLLCTSDCSKASWTTWTWGLRTWCCRLGAFGHETV